MVWVWKDLKDHLIQPAWHRQKYFPVGLRAASNLSLNTSIICAHGGRRAQGGRKGARSDGRIGGSSRGDAAAFPQRSRAEPRACRSSRRHRAAPAPLAMVAPCWQGPPRNGHTRWALRGTPGTRGPCGTPRAHGDPRGHLSTALTPLHPAVCQGASAKPATSCTLPSRQDKL